MLNCGCLSSGATNMSEFQAALFCSGGGTRMSSLTDGTQKCLLPIVGEPMFMYPLLSLLRAGVNDIKIFVRDAIKETLKDEVETRDLLNKYRSTAQIDYITVSANQEDYGTGDLLRHHHSKFTKKVLVVSGDFVSDASLIPFLDEFRANDANFMAFVDDNYVKAPAPGPKTKKKNGTDMIGFEPTTGRLAYLCSEEDLDGAVNMEKISNKFPNVTLTSAFNDCHVYALRQDAFQLICKNKASPLSFKADFVPFLIEQQYEEDSKMKCYIYRLPHENGAVTAHINTIGAYFEGNKAILKSFNRIMTNKGPGKVLNYRVDKIAIHDSRVEESSVIGRESVIKRTVILEGCKIGEKTKLKESVILNYVTIGNGATITNSIICQNAEIGENAEVTNCIVTRGQKVAAKSKVSNETVQDDEEWEDDE